MKMFVVGIQPGTAEQEDTFRKWITDKGMGFWHWIPNFWILHTGDEYTHLEIRNEVNKMFPGLDTLVVQAEQGSLWAGYGPRNSQRDMFEWLKKNWTI